jgi:hypothetical protein
MKKKLFLIVILLLLFTVTFNNANAQSSSTGASFFPNTIGTTLDYLGWQFNTNTSGLITGGTLIVPDLTIKNEDPMPISFYTNALSGGGGSGFDHLRMWIKDDGGASKTTPLGNPNDGFIGIGDFSTTTGTSTTPQHLLHLLDKDSKDVYEQFTNKTSDHQETDGLLVGIRDDSWAELIQQESLPMVMYTRASATANTIRERVRISDGYGGDNAGNWNTIQGVTKISLSHDGTGGNYLPKPQAMLNIGSTNPNLTTAQAGNRPWMDVGTYYDYGTDNMYVGLKDEGQNMKDAIINWGDDPDANPDNDYENLRFIFTGFQTGSCTSSLYDYNCVDGLEIARMDAHGNMGIGATFTSAQVPKRRLDIFDDGASHVGGHYLGGPQLRLTQALAATAAAGNWTDFQTMGTGDLYIHPNATVSAVSSERYVGINMNAPQSELHQHLANVSSVPQDVWHQFTNGNTAATASDGLRIGIRYNSSTLSSWAELREQEDAPMVFYTNDGSTTIKERMKITYGNGYNGAAVPYVTKVNINYGVGTASPITQNIAMLNLGESVPLSGGQRNWMDVGTFGCRTTDNFYYGLKYESADHADAALVWGDNLNGADGADNLRVIASMKAGTPGQQGAPDGLEVARFAPNSYVGIGNFAATAQGGSAIQPARRLEIYDEHLLNSNTAQPQLRLTYDPSTSAPINTDFQTTSNGDLIVGPVNNATARKVGIGKTTIGGGTYTPLTTLHVANGNVNGSGSGEITSDALNHTYSATSPSGNVWLVYSDANGTLKNLPAAANTTDVLHGNGTWSAAGGGGGGVSLCGSATTNYVTYNNASNSICTTASLYYDPTLGRLGINTSSPSRQLDIQNGAVSISDVPLGGVGGSTPLTVKTTTGSVEGISILDNASTPTTAALSLYATPTESVISTRQRNIEFSDISTGANIMTLSTSGGAPAYAFSYEMLNNTALNLLNYPKTKHTIEVTDNDFGGSVDETGLWVNNIETDITQPYSIDSWGIRSHCEGSKMTTVATGRNHAGFFQVDNGDFNYGVWADAPNAHSNAITENYAVHATALNSTNITTLNVAVYGEAPSNASGGGIGTSVAGYFNGDVFTTAAYYPSDSALKNNIVPLPQGTGTQIINQLNPKTYTFDQAGNINLQLPSGTQCGLLAEDVEQILPALVKTMASPAILDSVGDVSTPSKQFKAINYPGLIPYLIQGMKEQNQKIEDLTNQLADMQAQINNCCNSGNRQSNPHGDELQGNSIDVKLQNAKSIILNQNVPNPFAEQTSITYFITDDVKQAQIFFYDNKGVILKTVEISERGAGQLNVFAADLSSGSYTYSLIADSKLIETKKMVKTN